LIRLDIAFGDHPRKKREISPSSKCAEVPCGLAGDDVDATISEQNLITVGFFITARPT
jgi:hypothetical protein